MPSGFVPTATHGSLLLHASAVELGNSTTGNVILTCTPVVGAFPDEHGPPPGGGPPLLSCVLDPPSDIVSWNVTTWVVDTIFITWVAGIVWSTMTILLT